MEGTARLLTDPVEGRYGEWALAETEVGVLVFDLKERLEAGRGCLLYTSPSPRD